jgi:hypothetical protein
MVGFKSQFIDNYTLYITIISLSRARNRLHYKVTLPKVLLLLLHGGAFPLGPAVAISSNLGVSLIHLLFFPFLQSW